MTVKLLLLIPALALLTTTLTAQDNYRPGKKDLSWGVNAKGLRMTAWTNPSTDKVFVAVRNFSTKKICYCDPENHHYRLYARKNAGSTWQILRNKTWPDEIVWLPLCHLINLKPNEEKPDYVLKNKVREKTNYSFSLDLREYGFPADWSGPVEVKIVTSVVYCNNDDSNDNLKNDNLGEIESPIIEIKLPFTKAAAQR